MKSIIPIKILKFDDGGCHMFVNVTFNSKIKGKLIIDTGATKTVFDINLLNEIITDIYIPEELKSAGIEANMIESKVGKINKFKIGKLLIKDYNVVLINMQNINQLYENISNLKIWGLLGGDFLSEYNAKIDYKKKLLTIWH